uniref:Uncharacterized protein n=2 Tax=viral metagenome TaxID=1070528 RepID=A0A6M3J108_9ZZZZ
MEFTPEIARLLALAADPKSSAAAGFKEDGSFTFSALKPPKPEAEGAAKTTQPQAQPAMTPSNVPKPTFAPAIQALLSSIGGGVRGQDLAGLLPEDIHNVVGREATKRQLAQGTVGQLLGLPYQQAATKKALAPPEQFEELAADKWGRRFKRNKATGEISQIAGATPTTKTERPFIEKGTKNYMLIPTTGGKAIDTGVEVPKTEKEIPYWKVKLPVAQLDQLQSYIMDKDGNLFDQPNLVGIDALDKVIRTQGYKIVGGTVAEISGALKIPILDWNIPWFNKPSQEVFMIVQEGQKPTKQDFMNSLVSLYGYSQEEAEKARLQKEK